MTENPKAPSRIEGFLVCVFLTLALTGCNERHPSFYSNLHDAANAGEIARGWLPDFLPPSSHAIRIIYAAESSRTWCAFDFAPADDSTRLKDSIRPLDSLPDAAKVIDSPGSSWWPGFLSGCLDENAIQRNGYTLYATQENALPNEPDMLLFAIDWKNGHGFFYRTPIGQN